MTSLYPLRLFLDCSTVHLSSASVAYLNSLSAGSSHMIATTPYGWFLWAGDDPDEGVPADLVAVMAYARALDADYILFDADAPQNDELPIFDWCD